jgi:hypothetical protein
MADEGYGQGKPFDVMNSRGLAAKREYVRGLEQRGDDQALSLLVECLCDESWYLRDLAEAALLRRGPERAGVLVPHLEQGLWFTRASVARILGRLGHRAAVPALLRLCGDANATVVTSAESALIAIGRGGGAFRLAHALHRLPPDAFRERLAAIAAGDAALAGRVERLRQNEELMSVADPDAMSDQHPLVLASEEGVEWEVLTRPPPGDAGKEIREREKNEGA